MEVLTISKNKELLINEEIRDKEVRLVSDDGEQIGIVSIEDARRIAAEKNLDLVRIAPQANPPVCKTMDYGKHLFEQAKREREARKNQRVIATKEIRLTVKIDTHDFDTKARQANRFLKSGDKVKVTIRFRGRERAHPHIAEELMEDFAKATEEFGEIDAKPKMEGRSMIMFINPKS